MSRVLHPSLIIATLLATAACGGGEGAPEESASAVDSALPIPVLLDRFREGLTEPTVLTGGARSRDALVAAYTDALERADTAAFADLALTREEFAWLYYPLIPESKPPYELQPGLMWFMLDGNSGRGLRAALIEYGGRPLGALSYRCEGERRYEQLTMWGPCFIRFVPEPSDTVERAFFGPIVERDGVHKFVSFANKL
jgi:hypothetical protein